MNKLFIKKKKKEAKKTTTGIFTIFIFHFLFKGENSKSVLKSAADYCVNNEHIRPVPHWAQKQYFKPCYL